MNFPMKCGMEIFPFPEKILMRMFVRMRPRFVMRKIFLEKKFQFTDFVEFEFFFFFFDEK